MSWEEAKKLPIGIILLLGSGFALAKGCDESGLSTWLAQELLFLKDASPVFVIAGMFRKVSFADSVVRKSIFFN